MQGWTPLEQLARGRGRQGDEKPLMEGLEGCFLMKLRDTCRVDLRTAGSQQVHCHRAGCGRQGAGDRVRVQLQAPQSRLTAPGNLRCLCMRQPLLACLGPVAAPGCVWAAAMTWASYGADLATEQVPGCTHARPLLHHC